MCPGCAERQPDFHTSAEGLQLCDPVPFKRDGAVLLAHPPALLIVPQNPQDLPQRLLAISHLMADSGFKCSEGSAAGCLTLANFSVTIFKWQNCYIPRAELSVLTFPGSW